MSETKIVVLIQWSSKQETHDDLWKIIGVPFVPRVGDCLSFLMDDYGLPAEFWQLPVEQVDWDEDHPEYIEVSMEGISTEVPAEEFIEMLESLGWKTGCHWDEEPEPNTTGETKR